MKKRNYFKELVEEMEKKLGDWENSKGLSEERLKKILKIAEEMDKKKKEES